MLISDLIAVLKTAQEQHGDLAVYNDIPPFEQDEPDVYPVQRIVVDTDAPILRLVLS